MKREQFRAATRAAVLSIAAAAGAASIGLSRSAHADTLTWATATGSWMTPGAWSGANWADNSDVLFSVGATITLDQSAVANSIASSAATTPNVTIAPDVNVATLTLGAGGLSGLTNTLAINVPLVIGASQTWNKPGTNNITGQVTFTDGTSLTLLQANNAFSNPNNTGSGTIIAGGGTIANETLQAAGTGNFFGNATISLRTRGRISGNDTAATARTIPNAVILEQTASGAGAGMLGGQNNTGALTFTGPLTVIGTGTIQSDCGTAAGKSQSITFAGTTTLKGNLNLFTQNNGTNSNTTTFSGPITDDGTPRNFTKTPGGSGGGGLVVFSGTNTYTGTTTVSGGTLTLLSADLNNNIASSSKITVGASGSLDVTGIAAPGGFLVAAGQIFTGSGKVFGNVTVGSGATLAPGTAIGTTTFNNDLTFGGGGSISYDQGDSVSVAGNLNLIDGVTTSLAFANVASLTAGRYAVISYAGALNGSGTIAIAVPPTTRLDPTIDTATPNQVNLNIAGSVANLVWAGDGAGNLWNLNGDSNWLNNGGNDKFFNLDAVTFDDSSANNTVNVSGSVQPRSITVTGSHDYTIQGAGQIAGATSLTNNGSGTLTLLSANSYTGGTSTTAGKIIVGNGDALGSGSLSIGAGANVSLAPALAKAVKTGPLNVASGGVLDVNDGKAAFDYSGASPISSIAAQIVSGYAGGSWTGSGITSSAAAAAAASAHKTAVGYGEASAVLGPTGGTFAGQTVDGSTVLVRYTYSGDANLDGKVDTLDFNSLAANFGGTGKVWTQADFNYDGTVDTLDFNNLAANFGQALSDSGGGGGGLGQMVPEPASLTLVAAGLLAFRRRRRCRD